MKIRSEDERKFFEATGLDLVSLVSRHAGEDSEEQVFDWICLVLGHEYFEAPKGCYNIYTLRGWHQYVELNRLNDWFPLPILPITVDEGDSPAVEPQPDPER